MFSYNQHSLTSRVLSFFRVSEQRSDYYICTLCQSEKQISKPLSGKSKSNLRSHILNVHPKQFNEFCAPKKKFTLAKKRKVMMQSLAELVTVNGRAFEYLKDSGFQRLIMNDLEELSDGGMPINFGSNYDELKQYIAEIASNIKNEIKKDLEHRYFSIMMDIESKNNKSLLGINSQCIFDDDVVIHSLGVIPLDKSHTASYIQQKLTECLQDFDLPCEFVVSVTTDNAKNMLATTNKFDAHLKELGELDHASYIAFESDHQQILTSPLNEFYDALNDFDIREILVEAANEEELERILSNEDNFEQLFSDLIGNIARSTSLVNTVRCGAHTVQLMVRDALDKSDFKQILSLCRTVVKLLRTQKYIIDAKSAGIDYLLPLMFCTTRWDADLLMLKSLLRCETTINHFANTNRTFQAVQRFVPAIREAVNILEEPYSVTKMLQKPKCTLSDFFGSMIIMREKLKLWTDMTVKKIDFAQCLINQYEVRKGHLLDNEAMISAVYLDRRYSAKQDDDTIALAKLSLCRLWERVRLKELNRIEPTINRRTQHSNDSIHFNDFDIEQFLSSPRKSRTNPAPSTSEILMHERRTHTVGKVDFGKTKNEFMILLNKFEEKNSYVNHKIQIIDFWKNIKAEFPEIHVLASILNAIPPAQATVERVFSVVSFIFDVRRNRLGEKLLQDILMIRLNKDKLPKIFENENKMLKSEYNVSDDE